MTIFNNIFTTNINVEILILLEEILAKHDDNLIITRVRSEFSLTPATVIMWCNHSYLQTVKTSQNYVKGVEIRSYKWASLYIGMAKSEAAGVSRYIFTMIVNICCYPDNQV